MSSVASTLIALGGVASCAELAAHGHSLRAIDVPVAAKQVVRLRRGWVALPDAPADVTRAVRAGGTMSCISALRRSEVWTHDDERLHLRLGRHANFAAAEGKRPTVADIGAAGIVPHRTRTRYSPPAAVGGVDCIDVALAHAILCQGRNDAVAAADSALNRGLIRLPALTDVLSGLPAHSVRLLDLVDGRAESGIESHARLGLRAVGIPCRVQVRIDGVGRVDLLVGDRLIIEVDGHVWHSAPDQVRHDKARDLAAVERQYIVLRLTYAHVMFEWPRVLRAIRGIVARGEHRWSARHHRGAEVRL
jgi:very-short-patch-repair endonuclease